MSDKPIAVGDLVVVIRGHCAGDTNDLGMIFRTEQHWTWGWYCRACGASTFKSDAFSSGDRRVWERAWLRRIPPPEELLHDSRGQEITA